MSKPSSKNVKKISFFPKHNSLLKKVPLCFWRYTLALGRHEKWTGNWSSKFTKPKRVARALDYKRSSAHPVNGRRSQGRFWVRWTSQIISITILWFNGWGLLAQIASRKSVTLIMHVPYITSISFHIII